MGKETGIHTRAKKAKKSNKPTPPKKNATHDGGTDPNWSADEGGVRQDGVQDGGGRVEYVGSR